MSKRRFLDVICLFAELVCLIAFVLTIFRGQTQSISSFRTLRKTRACPLSRWAFCQSFVTGPCRFVTACIDQAMQGGCKLLFEGRNEYFYIWCIKMSRYTQCIHVCMLINTCTWICTVYMLINTWDLIQCLHVNIDDKYMRFHNDNNFMHVFLTAETSTFWGLRFWWREQRLLHPPSVSWEKRTKGKGQPSWKLWLSFFVIVSLHIFSDCMLF